MASLVLEEVKELLLKYSVNSGEKSHSAEEPFIPQGLGMMLWSKMLSKFSTMAAEMGKDDTEIWDLWNQLHENLDTFLTTVLEKLSCADDLEKRTWTSQLLSIATETSLKFFMHCEKQLQVERALSTHGGVSPQDWMRTLFQNALELDEKSLKCEQFLEGVLNPYERIVLNNLKQLEEKVIIQVQVGIKIWELAIRKGWFYTRIGKPQEVRRLTTACHLILAHVGQGNDIEDSLRRRNHRHFAINLFEFKRDDEFITPWLDAQNYFIKHLERIRNGALLTIFSTIMTLIESGYLQFYCADSLQAVKHVTIIIEMYFTGREARLIREYYPQLAELALYVICKCNAAFYLAGKGDSFVEYYSKEVEDLECYDQDKHEDMYNNILDVLERSLPYKSHSEDLWAATQGCRFEALITRLTKSIASKFKQPIKSEALRIHLANLQRYPGCKMFPCHTITSLRSSYA